MRGRYAVAALGTLLGLAWTAFSRALWTRPDAVTQALRDRYTRGEMSDDEYDQHLATFA